MKAKRPKLRAELIQAAIGENSDYRDESNGRDLEVGYLYGMADLITVMTLGDDESFSDTRHDIAAQIDKGAMKEKYAILPENGYKEPKKKKKTKTKGPLDRLEELLSLTEHLKAYMEPDTMRAWSRISAAAADLRDGSNV